MITISVIIPIYNVDRYVQRCLESVMTQTIFNAEIECIIVDDCGLDHSMEIVHQTIDDYQGPIHFEVVGHEHNRGLSAARNTGLYHATGDYVFFLDSDDYLMPDCYQYFLENLKQHPDVDMILGNVKACKGGDLFIGKIENPWLIVDRNVFMRRMLRHQIYLYAWNKLIRRDLLLDHSIRFEEGILFEDQCWSYELFSHLSSILLLPQVTYIYENNPNSIVNTAFTQEKADLVLKSYTLSVNKMYANPPISDRYHQSLAVDYYLYMMTFLMNGVDLISRCNVSDTIAKDFREVRVRLITRSLKNGRLILSIFFLLLFPPLCYVQQLRFFRRNYYNIEAIVNRICHVTDFLHNKKRI